MQRWQCLILQRYPINIGLIKFELDIHYFVSLYCLFPFVVSHFLFIGNHEEIIRMKYKIMIRFRFLGYRCIAIFAWRVIWNYFYSPFKWEENELKNKFVLKEHLIIIKRIVTSFMLRGLEGTVTSLPPLPRFILTPFTIFMFLFKEYLLTLVVGAL